jgi:hypothetical protein
MHLTFNSTKISIKNILNSDRFIALNQYASLMNTKITKKGQIEIRHREKLKV